MSVQREVPVKEQASKNKKNDGEEKQPQKAIFYTSLLWHHQKQMF